MKSNFPIVTQLNRDSKNIRGGGVERLAFSAFKTNKSGLAAGKLKPIAPATKTN